MANNEQQILAIRQNAKSELMSLKTIEDGIIHINKLKGIEMWVKAQKLDAELQVLVMEQQLRTKRIVGELLHEGKESGEILKSGERKTIANQYQSGVVDEENHSKKTIAELGLTKHQSQEFQKIASIPEEVFESHIAEAKEEVETAVNKLTTVGVIRLTEVIDEKQAAVKSAQSVGLQMEMEKKVDEILKEIKSLPVKYRLKIKQAIK